MYAEGKFIDTHGPAIEPVSFVIPAHNESGYLRPTILAIQTAISELGIVAEIIVVNDASTDDTGRIARELGVRVVDVSLRNIGAVRNVGAQLAQFNWLIFVDADTLVPIPTLRRTLQSLARGDVGGGARVEITDDQPLFWFKRMMVLGVVIGWQLIGRWAAGCYMFCRRSDFIAFGGFDENYFAAEELFFSCQLKRRGRFRIVPFPVVTSARKLHRYSTWELIRFVGSPFMSFRKPLQSKAGLELLYEDPR